MIPVNELRIGNYVYSTSHKQFCKITRLDYDSELFNTEPIELTEEILSKIKNVNISFSSDPQEVDASKCYNICDFKIYQPNENNNYFIVEINNKVKQIKYLHKLQNLFFEIEYKELEINL